MRRDDQINQALQMYVLLLRKKQLFSSGIALTHTRARLVYLCMFVQSFFFEWKLAK